MGLFEKFLSVWVAIAIAVGLWLGVNFPSIFGFIAKLEIAKVNIIIAILIWLMTKVFFSPSL